RQRARRILQWTDPAESLAVSLPESGRDPAVDGPPPRPPRGSAREPSGIRMASREPASTAAFVPPGAPPIHSCITLLDTRSAHPYCITHVDTSRPAAARAHTPEERHVPIEEVRQSEGRR